MAECRGFRHMPREWNTSRQCTDCGAEVPRKVKRCPPCNHAFLERRPTYERTAEHRETMSAALQGKRHNYRSASTRPEVAEKIRQAWTDEKRQAAQNRGLAFAADQAWRDLIAWAVSRAVNPEQQRIRPYTPGFGRLHRQLIRDRAAGQCELCGRATRLDIHHKDWSKDNHHPDNLAALCRKCHKSVHPNRQTPDAARAALARFSR